MAIRLLAPCVGAVLGAAILTGCGEGYSRAEVHYNLAGDLASDGDYYAVHEELSEAIRLEPGFTQAYYQRGLIRLRAGRLRRGG